MTHLLDLPEDVFYIIFRYLMTNAGVEGLIKLETTCKHIRRVCLEREIWVDALETLDSRPPLISSRTALLSLDASALRAEIIRSVKLDRSWKSGNRPASKEVVYIPYTPQNGRYRRAYGDFRAIPEVDLVFACLWRNGCEAWSISNRNTVWKYMELQNEDEDIGHSSPNYFPMTVGYEVADDSSSVTFALLYTQKSGEMFIDVIRLDAHTYVAEVLYKSQPMVGIGMQPDDISIRGSFVVVSHSIEHKDAFLVLNWRDNLFCLIQVPFPISPASAVTTDNIFFAAAPEASSGTFCFGSIRYRGLAGSSSPIFREWPTYKLADLRAGGLYSGIFLPYDAPPASAHRHLSRLNCQVSAVVSTWSRVPITQITVTTYSVTFNTQWPRVNVHEIVLVRNQDGQEVPELKQYYSSRERIAFVSKLSVAGRAMVRKHEVYAEESATRVATELCAFTTLPQDTEDNNTTVTRKEYRIVNFPINQTILDFKSNTIFQTMDPLGRILVYASREGIFVVRLDE